VDTGLWLAEGRWRGRDEEMEGAGRIAVVRRWEASSKRTIRGRHRKVEELLAF